MANTYKVLGQSNPAATTDTNIYTVPTATSAVVSTITVCNTAGTSATYRVAIRPAGATLATQHYISYDTPVPANDTITLTLGLTLAATDIVTIRASTATLAFSVFGTEIT